jgi:hypothetical protein
MPFLLCYNAPGMITKRQLGFIIGFLTLLGIAGIIGIDIVGAGEWSGFGPLQQTGIAFGLVGIITSVILILRGNRPA